MEHAVEVEQAVVVLDRFPALAQLDLTLPTGSVSLVQGPNGAGKTTLLRLLAGLVPLTAGSARVLGLDVATQRRQIRAAVGLMAPSSMLYEDLTIAENLRFWSEVSGNDRNVDAATRGATLDAVLDRLAITPVADQLVSTLSTGQRRRAALAAVAMRRPRLWLLDEPHAGLDQAGRAVVDQLILDAVGAGATVIVASHELDRVRPIATHVITVAGGGVHRCEVATDA